MNSDARLGGVFHILALDGAGGATPLSPDQIPDGIARDDADNQSLVWIHLNFEDEQTRTWIAENSGLNDIASEGLLALDTRPRAITRGDNLLLTLRGVNLNPGAEPDDMVSARIWTNGKTIISTQCRTLRSTDDVVESLEQGNGPVSVEELLLMWIDQLVWRMTDTVDNFEEQVLALEEKALSSDRSGLRQDFARLRKQTIVLRRYLTPQKEALNLFSREPLRWLGDMNRLRLRETSDRLIRHIEDIDEIRDRAAVAHEELISMLSEEMNQRMYVMSIVAALFLPLGFFTGLMGINVGGMPGTEAADGFWIVVGICTFILACLVVVFRQKRWL